jgi:hypothetical protein
MVRGPRFPRLVALLLAAAALTRGAPAHADRVAELGQMLESSSSEKERLSAVTALARLGDKRALKPLVGALHDPSATIRAVAAAALGHLGHRAALPALRAALDDTNEVVRKRAREAVTAVARANNVPAELPAEPGSEPATAAAATTTVSARRGEAGFGRQPRAVEARPDLFVLINSSTDDSPGKTDKATRKLHGELLRKVLGDSFHATPLVTSVATEAQRYGLDPRHLDVSVTKLEVVPSGTYMEIQAELRLAISDDHGKMLSFLSGGAKVQIPRRTYDARYLPDLRKEALENAVRGLFDKLLAHLRHPAQS